MAASTAVANLTGLILRDLFTSLKINSSHKGLFFWPYGFKTTGRVPVLADLYSVAFLMYM